MTANARFRLPEDYVRNVSNLYYEDSGAALRYQPHVYALADHLAQRSNARRVIDIGCGSGQKLADFSSDVEFIGIDHGSNLVRFDESLRTRPHRLIECNLNGGLPKLTDELLRDAVVICSDVVEHLVDPAALLTGLARVAEKARYLLLSTPARDRARGPLDLGPPANRAHCQEWTLPEFALLLKDHGIAAPHCGYTINTDFHQWKTTSLVVTGREAVWIDAPPVPVTAIVKSFNDADFIECTIRHLLGEGVRVHLIDNWSTDGTFEIAQTVARDAADVTVERFPEQPANEYDWAELLNRTVRVAEEVGPGWYLHYDSDELRASPWPGVSLRNAISRIDSLGYTALDFTVLDFRYLNEAPSALHPSSSMRHFEFGKRPGHFSQVKGWKYFGQHVDLASSGGHQATFDDRRVFPLKFLTRHFPLRGEAHAKRKIFDERLPRVAREREQFGWHVQYDNFSESDLHGWKRETLIPWHPITFESEYLVERLSGIGVTDIR